MAEPEKLIAAAVKCVATSSKTNPKVCKPHQEVSRAAPDLASALLDLRSALVTEVGQGVVGSVSVQSYQETCLGEAIPLAEARARELYNTATPSLVGVDSAGDVYDTTKRSSRECLLDSGSLSPLLATFAFPDEAERIRQSLCPTAESIEFRPYKLLLYGEGDFFARHVDTMRDALQFGSLALEVPVVADPNHRSTARAQGGALCFHLQPSVENSGCVTEYLRMRDMMVPIDVPTVLSLNYAAWLGDVEHEVEPVEGGFRIVIIYRMFKVGDRRPTVHAALTAAADRVMTQVATTDAALGRQTPLGWSLGIILRHPYPPAGLVRPALKGVDAIAYEVFSRKWKCCLAPACQVVTHMDEDDDYYSPPTPQKRIRRITKKWVFLTTELCLTTCPFDTEEAIDTMRDLAPETVDCLWIQLGLGQFFASGPVYGNFAGCYRCWYRHAVLLVTQQPGDWVRRRNAFLVGLRGPEAMQRLFAVADVFQHMVSFI